MLALDGKPFASGRAQYFDQAPSAPEPTAKVFVRVDLTGRELLAQVDTGAAFSMLETGIAETLDLLDGSGERTVVDTRFGRVTGRLERVSVTLIADEGVSLEVEATFFVSREWQGKTFLGYTGLLDRIRIALDPHANAFYFGDLP